MCLGAGKGESLLTVSMLGSPKPPGSNMLLGGTESSLQSAAVAESELPMCKQYFCDYRTLLICTGTNNSWGDLRGRDCRAGKRKKRCSQFYSMPQMHL